MGWSVLYKLRHCSPAAHFERQVEPKASQPPSFLPPSQPSPSTIPSAFRSQHKTSYRQHQSPDYSRRRTLIPFISSYSPINLLEHFIVVHPSPTSLGFFATSYCPKQLRRQQT